MLTDKWMTRKPGSTDTWAQDESPRGAGALIARITPSGSRTFYFRYTGPDQKQIRLPIGFYDPDGNSGLSLAQAREKAGELSRLYQTEKDLRGYLERQRRDLEDKRRIEDARREAQEAAKNAGTLRALLVAYGDHLERQNKPSAADVRRLLHLHVLEAHPGIADTKAAELTGKNLLRVISDLVEAGHRRTAAKVRSCLRAAYALALGAETDPNLPDTFRGFNLEINPAASLATVKNAIRPGERSLTEKELRCYLIEVNAIESPVVRSALLLALHLGGQRMEQLLRVMPNDIDLEGMTVRLFDAKGRREKPRAHVLPLTEKTKALFAELLKINGQTGIVFTANGKVRMTKDTPSKAATAIAKRLAERGELSGGLFQMRDIRRTCETMFAAMGISRDIRAQLLSHGLSGVQNQHYDRHDYQEEKRNTLMSWEALLDRLLTGEQNDDKVTQIRRSA